MGSLRRSTAQRITEANETSLDGSSRSQATVAPPSTVSDVPVTKRASSEAR
jgi:hypothetical protein